MASATSATAASTSSSTTTRASASASPRCSRTRVFCRPRSGERGYTNGNRSNSACGLAVPRGEPLTRKRGILFRRHLLEREHLLFLVGLEVGRRLAAGQRVDEPHRVALLLDEAVGGLALLRLQADHVDAGRRLGAVELVAGGVNLLGALVEHRHRVLGERD